MFGPVFLLEWKNASRRGRHTRFRAGYTILVAAEFGGFLYAWATRGIGPWAGRVTPWQVSAEAVADYLPLFMLQHLLLLLIAPAMAAGSIADEKSRGTLTLLLTTRLSAREIVLGKWLGQVVQVLVLAMPAVPLIAFLQAMSGMPPVLVGAWAVETLLLVMTLAALSLLASVWGRKATTAVAAVYMLLTATCGGVWLAGYGDIVAQLTLVHPAYWGISNAWRSLMLGALALSVCCLVLSAWRLRTACGEEEAPRPRRRWLAWLDRPLVGDALVRWKERYIGDLGLFAFARRLPRWVGVGLAVGLGLLASTYLPGTDAVFVMHGIGMILIVGLLVAVRSSGAICRERERQAWDGLLMTPLEPHALIRGKLWGIIDSVKPYLLAYLAGTLAWAVSNGPMAALITAICWLACWPFLYFQAANGLYHSVRAQSSWQAMVRALASGMWAVIYQAAFALMVGGLCSLVFLTAWYLLLPGDPSTVALVGIVIRVAGVAVFVIPFCFNMFADSEALLQKAENHVARQDRIEQDRGQRQHAIPAPRSVTRAPARWEAL